MCVSFDKDCKYRTTEKNANQIPFLRIVELFEWSIEKNEEIHGRACRAHGFLKRFNAPTFGCKDLGHVPWQSASRISLPSNERCFLSVSY